MNWLYISLIFVFFGLSGCHRTSTDPIIHLDAFNANDLSSVLHSQSDSRHLKMAFFCELMIEFKNEDGTSNGIFISSYDRTPQDRPFVMILLRAIPNDVDPNLIMSVNVIKDIDDVLIYGQKVSDVFSSNLNDQLYLSIMFDFPYSALAEVFFRNGANGEVDMKEIIDTKPFDHNSEP